MRDDLEKIIQADEAARQRLEAARNEAEKIIGAAEQQAQKIAADRENELAVALQAEQERVFEEAQARTRNIQDQLNQYIARINQQKHEVWDALLNELLALVTAR
jgi:vacuolar-type H+-ATPase subunit H